MLMALPCCAQTTTGTAKTKGACSPAVSGNNNQIAINCRGLSKAQAEEMSSILNKILANQINPKDVMTKLDEILKAVNPNARTTTYNCSGNQSRSSGPGTNAGFQVDVIAGDDSVFREMIGLNNSRQYSDLLKVSLLQMQAKPEWLTPRLFAGLAYLGLGDRTKANDMMKEFDSKSGPAYEVDACKQISNYLHAHLP
jgi:hypothetical protein